ncbi:MAG TPA: M15 family metallopeptidase [Gemmatimonadaceae bacterium]
MRIRTLFLASILVLACAHRPASAAGAPPINTVDSAIAPDSVARRLLVDVHALDSNFISDARYSTANNFTGALLPGYGSNTAMLRREAAAALVRVEKRLAPEGLTLRIFDGYWPVRATLAMVAWTERSHREDLLRDEYFASRSRHNLGLAIDLTLADRATGQPLEMDTPFDALSADAHTANATGIPATNRARLNTAMSAEGFTNYDQEWWHFTLQLPDELCFDLPIT